MTSVPSDAITPRGEAINLAAAAPFDARRVARTLLHESRVAALATNDPGGFPYGTVTNLMTGPDGAPVFFAAGLALHARNLLTDDRMSLTIAPFGRADVLTGPRLTLSGRAQVLDPKDTGPARRYLARFPKAGVYLQLPDAMLFRVAVLGVKINGGPARNAADLTPADLAIDVSGAGDLLEHEADEVAALNARNAGAVLAGAPGERWRVAGFDPDGIDLVLNDAARRIWFASPLATIAQVRREIADRGV